MNRRPSRLVAPATLGLAAALLLSACGTSTTGGGTPSGSSSPAQTDTSSGYVTGTAGVTVTGAAGAKPTVAIGADTPKTTELTVSDITVGTGAEIKAGDTVTAHYVGVGALSGEQFDSSWDRGKPAQFGLDGVIEGWQKGIPGMRIGGRRLLVIPGALGYGSTPPSGSGIQADEVLVFVVDIVETPVPTVGPHVTGTGGVTVSGAPGAAPTAKVSAETATVTELTLTDLVEGTADPVAPGATVTVNYVGYGGITGAKFDSSWDRGQPASFPLSGVITGWQDGIPGMKVGGRRLLVIPGAMAYGATPPDGSGIKPNEPLVFVVDLVSSP
jgi:peptidylprolyl isomerase